MLSKCANPECGESFRYLHEGKIFRLSPTTEVHIAAGTFKPALHERFWLCARCSKKMTLVWGGTQVILAPLTIPIKVVGPQPLALKERKNYLTRRLRARFASASCEDRRTHLNGASSPIDVFMPAHRVQRADEESILLHMF